MRFMLRNWVSHLSALACQHAPYTPQAARIETDDDEMPVRNQAAIRFAQHLVRVTGNFQGVRQHNGIDGVTHDWPVFGMTTQSRQFLHLWLDTLDDMMGNAAVFEVAAFPGWVQHQQMVAKQGGQFTFQRRQLGLCQ